MAETETLASTTSPPDAVKVKNINRKSGDWQRYHQAWEWMWLLYVGGVEIESRAEEFLKRRPKEPSDVYQTRTERFKYENHAGSATDYYLAALFETPPRIQPAIPINEDEASEDAVTPEDMLEDADREFYDDFYENCDRAGTPFIEHARTFLKHLILYGRAATLVDLPPAGDYATKADEIDAGQYNPYLCPRDPRQVINAGKDPTGNLEWIVLYAREQRQDTPLSDQVMVDRWYYFNRQEYAIYERVIPANEKSVPDDAKADRVAFGAHSMSKQNKVPVIYREAPEGLWLMNRAYLSVKSHLNTSNCLKWGLEMAALAMPYVKMEGDIDLTITEVGVIKLPLNSEYGWTEPEGKCWEHLAKREASEKEEIYRQFYLISQARSNDATPAAASGVSKQQDMMASKKILNLLGGGMRSVIQATYDMVSDARGDDVEWDVRGLDFPEAPPNETLDTVEAAKAIDVPSDTFDKELDKLVVETCLPDANQATKQKIFEEIDSAPSRQERELQQAQQEASTLIQNKMLKQEGV